MQEHQVPVVGIFPTYLPRSATLPPLVALLIDGDNVQLSKEQLDLVIHEAENVGDVAVRRVYGNWAASAKSAWKTLVLTYAFTPIHHIPGLPGKNATDIALVVDAMDLFYTGITVFFLVTSDSDYTPLIQRLRSSGCQVIGVGNPVKNSSLIPACTRFLSLTYPAQEQVEAIPKQTDAASKKKEAPVVSTPKKKATPAKKETSVPASKKKVAAAQKATLPKKSSDKKKILPMLPTSTTKEILTTTTPVVKVIKPLDDPDLTQAIESAFATIMSQQQTEFVLLVDVTKALKERMPPLRSKDYGKSSLLFLIKERTDLFLFQKVERDGKFLDEMRRRESSSSTGIL